MARTLPKLLLSALLFATAAQGNTQLPDIGTAGVSALSIEQEMRYGEAFMRFARAGLPIIDDPVLSQYLNDLGQQLVSRAGDVRFPFTFFLVNDPTINAAAFLGGRVKVHTGLFLYADSESELASVLAHEISHVTQRHIARYLEAQANSSALTMAGMAGSIALAMINPTLGAAALQTTMGISMQVSINYTRDNEYEADRIGMQTLYESGFEPMGMANFFQKLAAEYRFASKPPEMLMTHPLPETRISEARARAANYPPRKWRSGFDFALAKARIQARYGKESPQAMLSVFERGIERSEGATKDALVYGKVLLLLQLKRNDEAEKLLMPLATRYPDNLFMLDTLTDLDMAKGRSANAIARLTQAQKHYPENEVVLINLANAYIDSGKAQQGATLLNGYLRDHDENLLAWNLLVEANRKLNKPTETHLARCETLALRGDYPRAIEELNVARGTTKDKLTLARIEARIDQLEAEQQALNELKR